MSIHTVVTDRRERFYWAAILFALGTAAGDLFAERFEVGYLTTGIVFGVVIAGIALAYFALRMNAILAFWLVYIFTRPLGDWLAQPAEYGGLGFSTTVTSFIFLGIIAAIVLHMSLSGQATDTPERAAVRRT